MYEIELKAHVEDRQATIEKINAFAVYCGEVHKSDTYYRLVADGKKISTRIRKETRVPEGNRTRGTRAGDTLTLLTYKRKEKRMDANGIATEVNDEKECTVSDAAPLEALLADIGFEVSIKKEKQVMGWTYENAHLELCTVPPLGDFLEIEILSPDNDAKTVQSCQQELQELLEKAGISKDKIEERYYSDMLREAQKR